ncbi:MAG: hypothetical protein FJZ86_17550 [Chloroflexi bacterium]|nr:hypothetical protein [Chloroflexota bacterium]
MSRLNNKFRDILVSIQKKSFEYYFYLAILVILFLSYMAIGFFATRIFDNGNIVRDANFGFNQLKLWRFREVAFVSFIFLLLLIFFRRIKKRIMLFFEYLEKKPWRVGLFIAICAITMTAIFLIFSTNFINKDGRSFQRKFDRDVPALGAHVTHDEMWELYFHSRFWFYTNQYFGWDVRFSYRVISSFMGGVFIYALLKYAHQRFNERWFAQALLICSGGYMQLFFGDVENYTITAVLIFIYFWFSDNYIQKKNSLIAPTVILSIALVFHLLSGFFLPSLMYLYILAIRRRQFRSLISGFILSVMIISLNLVFFSYQGLPIDNLWTYSHASGDGGRYDQYLVSPGIEYYSQIINLLFLLMPAFILTIPLIVFKRIKFSEVNIFLLISTAGALLLTLGWKAQLGVYNDWNLFAITALPISLLVWNNFHSILDANLKSEIALIAGFVFSFHSLSWVISNHLIGR